MTSWKIDFFFLQSPIKRRFFVENRKIFILVISDQGGLDTHMGHIPVEGLVQMQSLLES